MSAQSVPTPTRHDPPVSARVPARIQRAARARAETLGLTYGQYITRLIVSDTADNVGPLVIDTEAENSPETEN
jgi:hypothetical protein